MAISSPSDLSELSGVQRAAVLVMYLDRHVAKKLLSKLTDAEVQEIGYAMASVERVDPELIEHVIADFIKDLYEIALLPKTGKEFALEILPDLVSEDRRAYLDNTLKRTLSTEFSDYIGSKPPAAVAALLQDEHPQSQAVALLLMGPKNAAAVLSLMREDIQYEIALRMAKLKEIPTELANDVEQSLYKALETEEGLRWTIEGVDKAAQILGRMESHEDVLTELARYDRNLSDTLRRRMVTFEDLGKVDDRGMQAIIKELERDDLILALKGASPTLREVFFKNMSSRAAADMKDDLEILGPTPRSLVEKAQEQIVEIALRLQKENTIYLPIGGGEDLV